MAQNEERGADDSAYSEELSAASPNVVQGTAESMISKLENSMMSPEATAAEEGDLLQSSEPGPLDKEGKDVEDVLGIISQSIFRAGEGHSLMKLSDRTALLSVVSHSLSAYITTLEPAPLQRLSARIASEVSLWLCDLFKFTNGAAYCHDDTREGLVKLCRLTLHKHYSTRMSSDGFKAFFSHPPVIYLTSNTYQETMLLVCKQLGLPASTIRLLRIDDGEEKEAVKVVEEAFEEDKAAGKLPIMCVANVHSSLVQSMDVCAFEAMCRRHDIWLHLEGNALAGLILVKAGGKVPVPTGDSMALTLGAWIGVPAVPYVTLYKLSGDTEASASVAGLTTLNPSVRLSCLPLWCVLRSLGERQLAERIENTFEMLEVLNNKLAEFECLKVLSQRSKDEKFVPIGDLSQPSFDVSRCYRTVNPALAFQYVSETPPPSDARVPVYFNNLNSWLGQTMQRDCGQVPLEIVDVETTGYVLRLCPFESLAFSGATLNQEDMAAFIECLEMQTSILNATVVQREKFLKVIDDEPRLERVDIVNWAGLGGIRYVPTEVVTTAAAAAAAAAAQSEGGADGADEEKVASGDVTADQVRNGISEADESTKDLIDHRNIELVDQLRHSDSAFSLGEGADRRICVRFGMVSMETDVSELLTLVVKTGIELDEQVAQLNDMGEVIRRGIEQAQGELRRDADDALLQEGILRHVPIVGSFVNWFSPVTEKANIKGRCLSLNEGRVVSTTQPVTMANGGTQSQAASSTTEDAPEVGEVVEDAPAASSEVANAAE